MEKQRYWGYRSRKALVALKDFNPGTIWFTTEGKEVFITYASRSPEGPGYFWDDKEYVGEIVKYVRQATPADLHMWR